MCLPTHPRAIIVRLGSELERSRELESGRELAGLHKDTKPIIRKQRQVYYRARCGRQSPHRPLRFKVGRALSLSAFAFITCFVTYMTTTPQPSTTTCRMCGPWHRVRLRTCKVALQEIQPAFHSRLDGGQCGIVHCTDHHTQPLAQVCEASSRRHIIHPRVPWRGIAVGGRQHGGNLQGTSLCAQH